MARNKRDRRSAVRLARPFSQALGHTANRRGDTLANVPLDSMDDLVRAVSNPTVRPLIRTVLAERPPFYQSPPRSGKRQSPLVSVRATFRSSDRATRSPFLNATAVTPQLTERAIICAKRNIRREVIFATKRTGKGAKSPRRSPSKVRC